MKQFLMILTFVFTAAMAWAAEDWSGCYSGFDRESDSVMEVNIHQSKGDWQVDGSAAFKGSARSPVPDFVGSLRKRRNDVKVFSFEDSFGNQGTMEIARTGKGIMVTFQITTLEEPRCMAHYFERTLQKAGRARP